MSDLLSVNESQINQINYHAFNKLIDASRHLMKGSDTQKYYDLGKKYLTTLLAEVMYFQLKLDVKTIKKLQGIDYFTIISQQVNNNKDPKSLLVAIGMLCCSNISQAVQQILSQLSTLIQNLLDDLNEKEKEESFLNFDMNKKLNILHLSTDADSQGIGAINDVSFTQFEQSQYLPNKVTFNLSYSQVLKNSQQIEEEIKKFMENKNYTSVFNLFLQFKGKTFNCDDYPDKDGNLFKHTTKLYFTNFLNNNEIIEYTATQLGTSKQDARNKANKQVLYKFFNAFPYVFKDFIHTMKGKNTNL